MIEKQNLALRGKYLTLKLKDELYGISVTTILQIIAIPTITPIPNTPNFVKGVINLRGKIIPVIDLRLKFNLEEMTNNDRTSIVIINFEQNEKKMFIGIIVDAVAEVIDIHENEIEDKPDFGIKMNTDFILGIAKITDRVVTLLNIEKILTQKELITIQKES